MITSNTDQNQQQISNNYVPAYRRGNREIYRWKKSPLESEQLSKDEFTLTECEFRTYFSLQIDTKFLEHTAAYIGTSSVIDWKEPFVDLIRRREREKSSNPYFYTPSVENGYRHFKKPRNSTSADRPEFEDVNRNREEVIREIYKIRHLTGFGWRDLAILMNVNKETLVGWMQGSVIPKKDGLHIAETLRVLRQIDRGTALDNEKALKQEIDGVYPIEEIKKGNFDGVENLIGTGRGRKEFSDHKYGWVGDYRRMVEHEMVLGLEETPVPLDEAPRASRKRKVTRV